MALSPTLFNIFVWLMFHLQRTFLAKYEYPYRSLHLSFAENQLSSNALKTELHFVV